VGGGGLLFCCFVVFFRFPAPGFFPNKKTWSFHPGGMCDVLCWKPNPWGGLGSFKIQKQTPLVFSTFSFWQPQSGNPTPLWVLRGPLFLFPPFFVFTGGGGVSGGVGVGRFYPPQPVGCRGGPLLPGFTTTTTWDGFGGWWGFEKKPSISGSSWSGEFLCVFFFGAGVGVFPISPVGVPHTTPHNLVLYMWGGGRGFHTRVVWLGGENQGCLFGGCLLIPSLVPQFPPNFWGGQKRGGFGGGLAGAFFGAPDPFNFGQPFGPLFLAGKKMCGTHPFLIWGVCFRGLVRAFFPKLFFFPFLGLGGAILGGGGG